MWVNNLLKAIYGSKKCHRRDLNLRPTDPEADTVATKAKSLKYFATGNFKPNENKLK